MQANQTDLQLFIDLGFILLAAFFLMTEQAPRLQVPLPGEQLLEQMESVPVVFEVHFDEHMQVVLLRQQDQELFCTAVTMVETRACLRGASEDATSTLLILSPQGGATLQQMVSILDLCLAEKLACTISGRS